MNRRQILLADDDNVWCHTAGAMLRQGGYDVHCVVDLHEASRRIAETSYDLLMLDIDMEGNRALEFVRHQRENDGDAPTPIVLLSAEPTMATAMDAVRLSVLDYLEKPLSTDDLLKRVAEAIEKSRLPQALANARQQLASLQSTLDRLESAVVSDRPPPPPRSDAGLRAALEGLSTREREVVEDIGRGLSTKQIASRLKISPHTVRNHLKAAYRKFGVRTRSGLMQRLLKGAEAVA